MKLDIDTLNDEAFLRVALQRSIIMAMHSGDPSLPFAVTVLRSMEQSAAMASVNRAIASNEAAP